MTIGLSISESENLALFGVGQVHLQDAMVEVARFLLNKDHQLVYGGDLNYGGGFNFTELLFQLALTYGGKSTRVTNYAVFPLYLKITKKREADIRRVANIIRINSIKAQEQWCAKRYDTLSAEDRKYIDSLMTDDDEKTRAIWSAGLTHMRTVMTRTLDAKVIIGGKLNKFKGRLPGVVEETLLAIESHVTVFVDGRFGGAAQYVNELIATKTLNDRYGKEFSGLDKIKPRQLADNCFVIPGKKKLPELEKYFTLFI